MADAAAVDSCVRVRVPLHVTGLWLPVRAPSPLETGSLGAGLLLEPPAVAVARPCRRGSRCGVTVLVEGRRLGRPPSVVEELFSLDPGLARAGSVVVELPAPLARGYAGSAAVALAAAVGLGLLRGRGGLEAARLAHVAEVRAGTGLGDVAAMYSGRMLELRLSPGAPGIAKVEWLPVPRDAVILSAVLGGAMETREMHEKLSTRLYEAAAPRLARLLEEPGFERFLEEARGLSIEAGFAPPRVAEALDRLAGEGLIYGWYAKKRVLVVAARRSLKAAMEALKSLGLEPRTHRVAPAPLTVEPCGDEGHGGAGGEGAELPKGEAGQ